MVTLVAGNSGGGGNSDVCWWTRSRRTVVRCVAGYRSVDYCGGGPDNGHLRRKHDGGPRALRPRRRRHRHMIFTRVDDNVVRVEWVNEFTINENVKQNDRIWKRNQNRNQNLNYIFQRLRRNIITQCALSTITMRLEFKTRKKLKPMAFADWLTDWLTDRPTPSEISRARFSPGRRVEGAARGFGARRQRRRRSSRL